MLMLKALSKPESDVQDVRLAGTNSSPAKSPHRIAVLLTAIVFPLIWFGGLVTSWDAGMAVPDWPGTFGYNMFAYPISTWFFGPWDLFVEHGHRLLASLSGLIAIALIFFTFRNDSRTWVRWYSIGLFLLVLFQGLLGGVRVLSAKGKLGDFEVFFSDRTMAKFHGCIGPAFFLAVVGFCVVTSRWWFDQESFRSKGKASRSFTSTWPTLMLVMAYCQLVVGAFLRHISESAPPSQYTLLVALHVMIAISLVIGTFVQAIAVARARRREPASKGLVWSMRFLILAIITQFCLGIGTWVVKFGWPVWFADMAFAAGFVVPEKSMFQMNLVTAHVAVGSLLLAFWTVQVFRAHRLFAPAILGGERMKP
jgi:cytochrome c oxidase assembly protein subunit 15